MHKLTVTLCDITQIHFGLILYASDLFDTFNKPTYLIKSPRSGVTLCFQFVSAASASTAAKFFPSHVKTFWAKPLIFGTKNIWVWGNVLDDLFMTLTQGHGCGVNYQKFACLRDKVRTTHRITTICGSFVALVMVITWIDCWKMLFWQIFFKNFGCVFSRSNTILAISQE